MRLGVSTSVKHPSHHHICLCSLWSSYANLHSDPTQIPTSLILGLHFDVNPLRAITTCLEFYISPVGSVGGGLGTGLI